MAGDKKIFRRAHAKWETLGKEGHFSKPAELGATAIISSAFTDDEPDTISGITELESFRSEVHALADRVILRGGRPLVAVDATRGDINRLIGDPDVAHMYFIGNGALTNIILDVEDRYDWLEAAQATTHQKLGMIEQRQCGGLTRHLNVPLGLFIVSNPQDVLAAVGAEFYPLSLDDPENDKIAPVFSDPVVTYESITAAFPRDETLI